MLLRSNGHLSCGLTKTWSHLVTLLGEIWIYSNMYFNYNWLPEIWAKVIWEQGLRSVEMDSKMIFATILVNYIGLNSKDYFLSLSSLWEMCELDKIISNVLFNDKLLGLLSSWQIKLLKQWGKKKRWTCSTNYLCGCTQWLWTLFHLIFNKMCFWQIIQNMFSISYIDRG